MRRGSGASVARTRRRLEVSVARGSSHVEHTAGGWRPALRSRQSTADPCRRASACREGIGGASRVAGGSRFSCDAVNLPVACRIAAQCRNTQRLLGGARRCSVEGTADDDSTRGRAPIRAGVRRRDSTRTLQVHWRCVHVQHSQRGLSTCLQATRDVEY